MQFKTKHSLQKEIIFHYKYTVVKHDFKMRMHFSIVIEIELTLYCNCINIYASIYNYDRFHISRETILTIIVVN